LLFEGVASGKPVELAVAVITSGAVLDGSATENDTVVELLRAIVPSAQVNRVPERAHRASRTERAHQVDRAGVRARQVDRQGAAGRVAVARVADADRVRAGLVDMDRWCGQRDIAIATATDEGEVVIWDAGTGRATRTLAVGDVSSLDLDEREVWISRGSPPGLRVFEHASGIERPIPDAPRAVLRAAATREGWIAIAEQQITGGAWSIATSRITSAWISADRTSTWTVGPDLAIQRTVGRTRTRIGTAQGTLAIAASSDGTTYATASLHRIAAVSRAGERSFDVGDAELTGIAISEDGRWLAAATSIGRIQIWDLGRGALVARLHDHQQRVTWIAFDRDRLWSAGLDRMVRRWDLASLDADPKRLLEQAIATWGDLDRGDQ